jgi:proline iminopeptidase
MHQDGFDMGYIRVRGHRIFYRARGEARKGTVVVLHGGPGGSHIGVLAFADLAQFGYRVVLFDHVGSGRSQRPRGAVHYTMERRAGEVEGVRRALRLGAIHLIGYSFGAPVALEVAIRYPRSLRSVTSVSGFTSAHQLRDDTWRQLRSAPRAIREKIERFERSGDLSNPRYLDVREEYARVPKRTSEGQPIGFEGSQVLPWEDSEYLARYNRRVDRMFVGRAADRLTAPVEGSLLGWDLYPRLKRIRVPTLVAVGRYDSVDIRHSRRIHHAIPGSKLVVFEKSGHGAPMEERDLFMRTVRDFLDRCSGPRPKPRRLIDFI